LIGLLAVFAADWPDAASLEPTPLVATALLELEDAGADASAFPGAGL
jgi:hypothetical protein